MIKPDTIVTHPKDILYPLFMQRINRDRHLFNKMIVVMTPGATGINFTNYVKDHLVDATIIEEYLDSGVDWRNAALTEGLKSSDGDAILFLEQDFLVVDGFFEALIKKLDDFNTIGAIAGAGLGERFHPSCLLVRKNVLNATQQDFSVDPDKGDHFAKLTRELLRKGSWSDLTRLPRHFHLNGLTQNYRLTKNWYDHQIFFEYNRLSQKLPQHNTWREFCRIKEGEMTGITAHPFINLVEFFL